VEEARESPAHPRWRKGRAGLLGLPKPPVHAGGGRPERLERAPAGAERRTTQSPAPPHDPALPQGRRRGGAGSRERVPLAHDARAFLLARVHRETQTRRCACVTCVSTVLLERILALRTRPAAEGQARYR